MDPLRRLLAVVLVSLCIALTLACDDAPSPKPPGEDGSSAPAASTLRLAWSQGAPSVAAVERYRFILAIDEGAAAFSSATCAGSPGPTDFECSGVLPALAQGRHTVSLSVVDPVAGLESTRSNPLVLDIGADGRPAAVNSARLLSGLAVPEARIPSVTCARGATDTCFAVTVVSTGLPPVHRLTLLPGGRLFVLHKDGATTMLPSGVFARPDFGARRGEEIVQVTDIAVDPDFQVTRFLFFAAAATGADGRRTIRVVRMRELADRLGEPATVVPDLPAADGGDPAVTIGPDRRVYLAVPGHTEQPDVYGGQILRFTQEGRADGQGSSPILASGPSRPTRLVWDYLARLLVASAEAGVLPFLGVVPIDGSSTPMPGSAARASGSLAAGLHGTLNDVAARASSPTAAHTLAMIEGNPGVLSIASLRDGNAPRPSPSTVVALGSLRPAALAFAPDGDLLVAATRANDPKALVLRLRRIQHRPEVGGQGDFFE